MIRLANTSRFASFACVVALGIAPTAEALAKTPALLVSCFSSDTVAKFELESGAAQPSLGPGTPLNAPLCARVGPDGLLYVASEGSDSVLRFDACDGAFVDVFVTAGSGGLNAPTGLDWGADGNLYVAGFINDAILRYDGATGAFLGTFVAPGSGSLNGPDNGTIFGPDGHLYVPSYWNNRILRYNGQTGAFMGVFVNGVSRPRVLVFREGMLFVTSETADAVYRYDASTGALQAYEIHPGTGGLDEPIGLAMGPDGDWYVSSGSQDAVYRFDGLSGLFKEFAVPPGTAGVTTPVFVTFVSTNPSGDLDGDGDVDGADLATLLALFGGSGPGDLDGDGVVSGSDLALLISQWGS